MRKSLSPGHCTYFWPQDVDHNGHPDGDGEEALAEQEAPMIVSHLCSVSSTKDYILYSRFRNLEIWSIMWNIKAA